MEGMLHILLYPLTELAVNTETSSVTIFEKQLRTTNSDILQQ